MENRLKINDVWYVKEQPDKEKQFFPVVKFEGLLYESDLYVFEATRLYNEEELSFNNSIAIDFKDKRQFPWKEEFWDNENWFLDVLNDHPDTKEILNETLCKEGLIQFKSVIKNLIEEKWLKQS